MGSRAQLVVAMAPALVGCSLSVDLDELDDGTGGAPAASASSGSGANASTLSSSGEGAGGPGSGGLGGAGLATGGGGDGSGAGGGIAGSLVTSFGEHATAEHSGVTKDTYVSVVDETLNYGTDVFLELDADPAKVGLLRFDLGSMPDHSAIVDATLHVWTTNDVSSGTFELYEMLEEWEEGATNGGSDACNWYDSTDTLEWSMPGVEPPARSSQAFASFVPADAYAELAIPMPADLVEAWVLDPQSNHGFAIVTRSIDSANLRSSEHADTTVRPRLDITYLP